MDISVFKSNLALGGQRANRFKVTLTNPANSSADILSPFLIESTGLPSRSQEPIVQYYFGRQVKLNGNVTYPDWTTTVICDGDLKLRDSLETWCNFMNGYQTNVNKFEATLNMPYKSSALVQLLDVRDVVVREYELVGLFPIAVESSELAWESNELMKFTCTWTYDYFLVGGDGNTGTGGGI